ncbi:hypothetical protein PRIPAC_93251 [Pristionchus pacificus]|uniref:Na/H antiporter n=1 Tax=Pristionchus pacificus TaxID=54126 RepID=A0A2A6BB23_PRIPA|nr:hypothetical protein PRIPAC_93251 [Pristionchus pacificus]|eukprot:PDM63085.1 Na/H antiporter [Pristionchus pacificus]
MVDSSSLHYFYFPCVAVILALIVDAVKKKTSFPLPESVLLFLIAVAGSFFLHAFLNQQEREIIRNEYLWLDMQPDAILGILLPPLLFESAYKVNMSFFLFRIKMIITLTGAIYILTAALVAAVYVPIFNIISGWHHFVSCILASILVATDPVAVVSILESMGAPLRLRILIEGESLLNDGLAIFAFKFFLRLFEQSLKEGNNDEEGLLETMTYLTRCVILSPLVGILLGHVTLWIMSHVEENKRKQCTLLLCVYVSYQLCDMVGSGALGLVCMGLAISHLKEQLTAETDHMAHEFWSTLGYIANAVIFVFAGVAVASELFTSDSKDDSTEASGKNGTDSLEDTNLQQDNILACICGFCLAPVTMIARSIGVYFIFVSAAQLQQTHRKPLASDYALLSFGGLRGALGLILAMEFRNAMREDDKDPTMHVFGRQMLIVTCLSTFFSLVVQGSLFGPFARAEEQTKRSVYADESSRTMYAYMKRMTREAVENRMDKTDYLVGTNWSTVLSQANIMFRDPSVYDPSMEKATATAEPEEDEKPYEKDQVLDVRSGFYHCLLARVHGAWERGAISARTAHVIIRIIEHGLDEGGLKMEDFTEHLNSIDASPKIIRVSSFLRRFTVYLFSIRFFNCFLLPSSKKVTAESSKKVVEIQVDRSQEKWFLFVAILSVCHSYMIILLFLTGGTHEYQLRFLFMSLLMSFFVISEKLLSIYHISSHMPALPEHKRVNEQESAYNRRVDGIKNQRQKFKCERIVLLCFIPIHLGMIVCDILLLKNRDCSEDRSDPNKMSSDCFTPLLVLVLICIFSTAYRLFRGFFIGLITLSETMNNYVESRERVRLSVLHYLLHMSASCKISRELFPAQAYITVRQEQKRFVRSVDALLRLELKKDVGFGEYIPAIKTRQAIRMIATDLIKELNRLREDGILKEDSAWPHLMQTLRGRAERVIRVPPLSVRDWLYTIPWIKQICNTENRKRLVKMLEKSMQNDDGSPNLTTYNAHDLIFTHGKGLFFVREGVCKVREWIIGRNINDPSPSAWRHHSYVQQGQIIGERNLLLVGRNESDKFHVKWPRIRYEAVTRLRGTWVPEQFLAQLVSMKEYASIRHVNFSWRLASSYLADRLQTLWMKTEIKHLERQFDVMDYDSFHIYFQTHGRVITKEETIKVDENRVAIIGCWTRIVRVSKEAALFTRNFHILGPAEVVVRPVDEHTTGMVVLRRYTPSTKKKEQMESEKSVISISIATHEDKK